MFRWADRCSEKEVFRQTDVQSHRCSDRRQMFRQTGAGTFLSIWQVKLRHQRHLFHVDVVTTTGSVSKICNHTPECSESGELHLHHHPSCVRPVRGRVQEGTAAVDSSCRLLHVRRMVSEPESEVTTMTRQVPAISIRFCLLQTVLQNQPQQLRVS